MWKTIDPLNDPEGKKRGWHCFAVKEISALLQGITSKNNGNFYCSNRIHSFRTKKSLSLRWCDKDFCGILMPSEKDNILKFN